MWAIAGLISVLLAQAAAFDCSAKELEHYNFELLKGIHSVTSLKDTPPSQTNLTWYFGICEPIKEGLDACPQNSDVCGITSIILKGDSKNRVISEIVSFNTNLQKTYEPFSDSEIDSTGIAISYTGATWGDNSINAALRFVCPPKNNEHILDKFKLDSWDGKKLKASMYSKAACITSDKDKLKPPPKKPDNGESWGWFTWIFIFLVLFLSIYIVGGAWFQYNKGNAIDFSSALREVLDNFVELLKGIPAFSREIIEKFTSNSNRGEYSAV
ncbi:predicted protein [Scheffersomyces stipitis CBS 6054]|uniref:Autophagy-related protein 27 n=1 Tax=Scheffersomyces stipitis (strain ATCC 58785 / CBS 6054 / NBRC 10063 / NRRL Y-11545) TaxID=322104 RepID=ATG27_PICST|nr:predicted protein [Scheffersomyces stipitis CBS 6054]A3LW83.2 RecName: Full=Autophagy-related protein 27; Flags: Precursor [Scheffersomyces stipitis CBS 6054]ABN67240.2 predicted protein [Scheffersomyces stipitis CBS 6054]KAG2734520.1 hypothetical protein G9P44_002526 [Scheffersomyces stipitis]